MKMLKKGEGNAIFVATLVVLCIIGFSTMHSKNEAAVAAPLTTPPTAKPIETKEQFEARVAANNREQKAKAIGRETKAEFERRVVAELDAKEQGKPETALEIVRHEWHKGGFDTVALWSITFLNKSDKPIGNIRYRTTYYAETRDKVDQGGVDALLGDYTIRKVIAPHKKRTIEINDGFVNREASSGHFEVVSCEFIEGGAR